MKPVLIVYATREGHTRKIAEHVAANLSGRGTEVELVDAKKFSGLFSPENYSAAIIAGSVHSGGHESEIVQFARVHAAQLERVPTLFLSVSLSEAGAENAAASPAQRSKAAADVQRMIDVFVRQTGWRPSKVKAVAGALMYSRYGFFKRFVMKGMAAAAGGSTDTTRDHVYTNWQDLDRVLDEIAPAVPSNTA